MAGISTSITLNDRMSGTLNRIQASLNTTLRACNNVDQATEEMFNPAQIQAVMQELYRYDNEIISIQQELDRANNRIEQMQDETNKARQNADGLNRAFGAIKGVIATLGLGIAFGKLITASDTLVQSTARINMMNDGLQSTDELITMIYNASQNARGSFDEMTDVVARFGNNAKEAFGSSAEVVAFSEIIQKQMALAGTDQAGAAAAMLQLSQALGSGVLRGEELNSVFEQAPPIIRSIAEYLGVPMGQIRAMAAEGQITADIVKNAVFASADEVNAKFASMPMTFGQISQRMGNQMLMSMKPALTELNNMFNDQAFQQVTQSLMSTLTQLSLSALQIIQIISRMGKVVVDNWGIVSPILISAISVITGLKLATIGYNVVTGIAAGMATMKGAAEMFATGATMQATIAQYGFNAAILACPITWIIIAIVAFIGVLVAVANQVAKTTGVAQTGFGIIAGTVAFLAAYVWNLVQGLINFIITYGVELYNYIAAFANFFGNVFNKPVESIIGLFLDVFNCIVGVVEGAAGVIDMLLGSNISGAIKGFRSQVEDFKNSIVGEQVEVMAKLNADDYKLKRVDPADWFNAGASWGDGLMNSASSIMDGTFGADGGLLGSEGTNSLNTIADNTGTMASALSATVEDLKYLRDIAERDAINRFTTAEIKVDMNNNNNINSAMDIDGIIDKLVVGVNSAMEMAAEGVY